MRMFLSGATECELDSNGRIIIPGNLINYCSLEKDAIILGVNERLEIWAENKYEEFFNNNIDKFSDVAEGLFTNEQ